MYKVIVCSTALLPVDDGALKIILLYASAAFIVFAVRNIYLMSSPPGGVKDARSQFSTRYWIAASIPMVFGGIKITGCERAIAVTTVIVLIFNVIGNLLAIPRFGATGAAVVTACSVAVLTLWQDGLLRWRPHR